MYKCICGKEFEKSQSYVAHCGHCKIKHPGHRSKHICKCAGWNRGLTAKTDIRLKKQGESYHKGVLEGRIKPSCLGKSIPVETRKKISSSMKGNSNFSVERLGRGKKGSYKGFFCASRYELAYVVYCLDHNIKIERNKEYFYYEYDGKKRRYYPDFIVDNTLIEIKGFHTDQVDIKLTAVNKPIKILYYKDIEHCFKYIEERYGLNYANIIRLYE